MRQRSFISISGLAAAAVFFLGNAQSMSAPESPQTPLPVEDQSHPEDEMPESGTIPVASVEHHLSRGSALLKMEIDSANGDKVAEVADIVIDVASGNILAILVSTGGFLDFGQDPRLVAPQDLRFENDRKSLSTNLTRDQILAAPPFLSGDEPGLERVPPIGEAGDGSADIDEQEGQGIGYVWGILIDPEVEWEASGNGRLLQDLVGMSIKTVQGESVGSIKEVYLHLGRAKAVGVVVSTGGFLGVGERNTLLAFNELAYDQEEETFRIGLDKDQLAETREYNENESLALDLLRDRMGHSDANTASLAEDSDDNGSSK